MSKFYPLTVAAVKNETRDTIAVRFQVPMELKETFDYLQGQHLTLRAAIDGEEMLRSYSICSAAHDDDLRIAIKRAPGGAFSTWANDTLKPGYTIDVMPPMGRFNTTLSPGNRKKYLGFAAGSGITPMLSIAKTTLSTEALSEFTLVYGNRSSSTVIFKEELAEIKDAHLGRFNLVHVMSREQQDVELFNGRITREKCDELFDRWIRIKDHDFAFLCGPEGMMRAVSEALLAHGMPKACIKRELFSAGTSGRIELVPPTRPGVRHECEVKFIMDGREHTFAMDRDTESVLDGGLRQGLDMRFSCKAGVCSTCRAKVVEGRVDMDVNLVLEDYEIARGFVLTCQSFPATDRLVLDFDQDM